MYLVYLVEDQGSSIEETVQIIKKEVAKGDAGRSTTSEAAEVLFDTGFLEENPKVLTDNF